MLVGDANWEALSAELRALDARLIEARLTDEALEGLEQARAAQQDRPN